MKYIFSSLNGWQILLVMAALASVSAAQTADPQPTSLVLEAARQVARYPTLEARVRQQVSLFGHDLNGHGTYQQARIQQKLRLRYELRLPLGDRSTHMQQINDGDYVWVHHELLDGPQLSVINLRRVRAAVESSPTQTERLEVVGGLAQLLYGLYDQFDFAPPREGSLGKEPVWILDGTWRSSGVGQGDVTSLAQIPQSVRLVLSRDQLLPLFPFRVEYAREEPQPDGTKARRVIMNVEFFEVRAGGTPDPRSFTFTAGDQAFHDATDEFIASLK